MRSLAEVGITYGGERTAPGVAHDCRHPDCDEHYVVRINGTWAQAFHNERDARIWAGPQARRVSAQLLMEG